MEHANILIVEDEAIVAEDLRMTVTDLGYTVVGRGSSADEAVAKTLKLKPDLILMDIVLKGDKTGIDASCKIKKRMDVPIIFLTAYSDIELIDKALAAKPHAYIVKPFQAKQLLASIEMALYKSRMERRLREAKEWIATTLDSIGDAVIATDTEGIIQFMNPVAETLTGWDEGDAVGKHFEDVFKAVQEETGSSIESPVTKVLKEGSVAKLTDSTILISRDGLELPIDDSSAPIRDHNGDITGVVLVFHDITERRQAESALRVSEQFNSSMLTNSPNPVLVTNPDSSIQYANPAFEELTGFSAAKLIGVKAPYPWWTREMRASMKQGVKTEMQSHEIPGGAVVVATGCKTSMAEEFFCKKNGERFWVEITSTPVTSNGMTQYHLSNWVDITERKAAEAKINKLNEELEHRVEQRTLELKCTHDQLEVTRGQFYQAQKMESLGILAGGIAHDFNNLLTVILGNLSLAKMIPDNRDKTLDILAESEKASLQAKKLTQQLLTFSKGGAPVKTPVPIKKIISDSAGFAMRGSNVRSEISIPNNLWHVEVDEGQINQVISNMVINATQAMPDGGTVQVQCENAVIETGTALPLDPGRYVQISIKDHGTGISEEHAHKIFDPFFTTKPKGSGLGLATAYTIVKRHNGHIGVESKVGSGTTFNIHLPACKNGASGDIIMEEKHEKQISVDNSSETQKILVMDDETDIRNLVGDVLTHFGHNVEFASDGAAAIKLYQSAVDSEKPFNVVIMDLTIPGGVGGKEAIKELLEIDPDVRAIVSSGYSNDPIMADFKSYGFKGVVAKPYEIRELVNTLNQVIAGD
ncbi:MAG: response regulator [Methanosarcinales archaeon]|nr:MAG: response regulator [Methanosarcinales archaeon]